MATVSFHGVRGSCPCSDPRMRRFGGATSCVSVQPAADVPPIVLDLGTGARMLGEELVARYLPGQPIPIGAPAVGTPPESGPPEVALDLAVFVSHLHFDHIQGLPFFGPALRRASRLTLFGPRPEVGSFAQACAGFVQPPYFPVQLGDLPAELILREVHDGESVAIGDALVTARSITHVGRTLGFRVEVDGFAVAYLADHQAPKPGHVGDRVPAAALELAREADVLVHDAQYTEEEFAVKLHWGHSTIDYALEVASAASARRVVLFHHDPTHDDELLDQLGADAAARAGDSLEVVMAAEGLTLKLGE